MKLTKLNYLIAFFLLGLVTGTFAQRPFNKNKDILIAQFDSKPDPDDIHAQAALGSMLAHSDFAGVKYFAVAGAVGKQGGRFIDSDALFNMAFGNNWTDADANRSVSVTNIKNKVKPILQNGGKVWVQEAGQSDITRDWIQALKNDGVASTTIKNNVIVVQHSKWNEDMTSPGDLNWVKSNANYKKIADGNSGGNGTPSYRSINKSFLNQAKNSKNAKAKALWIEADRVIQKHGHKPSHSSISTGGVDYSDCVENWWIFSIGGKADNISKFWSRYVTNTTGSNPDPDPDPNPCTGKVFEEKNGVAAVEAEGFVNQSKTQNRKWYVLNGSGSTPTPDPDPSHHNGASDGGYLEILPDTRVTHGDPLQNGINFSNEGGKAAIVNYKVKFNSPGKYFVWVRAFSTGSEDNGVHVGINGTWPASGQRMQWCAGKNQWTWESKQRTNANHCGEAQRIFINVPSAGVHTISFSLREDGFEMDKFVLSKAYTKPSGTGPTPIVADCGDTDPDPTPTGSCGSKPSGFKASSATNTSITVNYTNTSSDSRTFELRAFNKGTFSGDINTGVVAFASGNAGSNAITISGLTAGKSYDLVLRALCQDGTSPSSPVAQIIGTTEGGTNPVPTQDKITISNVGNKPASSSMTFTVNYDATQKRTLYAEVRGPRVNGALGKWYGSKTVDVNAGSGNQNITVGLSSVPPTGSGYQVRVHIRPINSSWQQAINADSADFIVGSGNGGGNPPAPISKTVTLSPIEDAYLQGSKRHNTSIVRIEQNKRAGYLMFDLSSIEGTITKADLQFTVDSDPGNGNVNVNKGNSDNWTENNLSNANKPGMGDLLGNLNTGFAVGSNKTISLNAGGINGEKLSLIINATSGNDFAFAAKDHKSVKAPQLVITYTTTSGARQEGLAKTVKSEIKVFPVPMKVMLNLSGVSNGSVVRIDDFMGRLQKQVTLKGGHNAIDVQDLPSGHYILTVLLNNEVVSRRIISK
ncbi:DUF7594 domain-containing protein [Aquimarina aggregata]|uniref:CBM96 family carbohydrate-binding protein n=1 Tax=Aquimarina aggregata TaxID=1642818 RepID=UPI0024920AE8|nr:T9SS type A sorting domain-containing protein [Aquimarina aggregata]